MDEHSFSFSAEWIIAVDDDLIVVNKPSGLRTIPDGYNPTLPCLSHLLEKEFSKIWVVHRLDKETSGLVLFARSPYCHKVLNSQFLQRTVKKLYTAIICGNPKWQYLDIRLPLQVNGDRKHRTIVNTAIGKPARSEVEVVRSLNQEATWVKVIPHSGYTHQIRAHLAAINFPILNDVLYFKTGATEISRRADFSRIALHAYHIAVIHPANHSLVEFTAPLPSDFQNLIGSDAMNSPLWQ